MADIQQNLQHYTAILEKQYQQAAVDLIARDAYIVQLREVIDQLEAQIAKDAAVAEPGEPEHPVAEPVTPIKKATARG